MAAVAMYDPRQNPGNGSSVANDAAPLRSTSEYGTAARNQSVRTEAASASHGSHDESPDRHASDDSQDDDDDDKGRGAKRRKLSKDADKKFICPAEGCDKKYSRAEHLYRHQLNHNPKQIYVCDHPGCDRRFVRADLCARHKERHNSRESGLVRTTKSRYDLAVTYQGVPPHQPGKKEQANAGARRDSTMAPQPREQHMFQPSPSNGTSQAIPTRRAKDNGSTSPVNTRRQSMHMQEYRPQVKQDQGSTNGNHMALVPQYAPAERPARPSLSTEAGQGYHMQQSPRYTDSYSASAQQVQQQQPQPHPPQQPHSVPYAVANYAAYSPYHHHPAEQRRNSTSFSPLYQQQVAQAMHYLTPAAQNVTTQQSMPGMTPFAPSFQTPVTPGMHTESQASLRPTMPMVTPMNDGMFQQSLDQTTAHLAQTQFQMNDPSVPVFNNEIYNNAPFVSADDFTQWLFDNNEPNFHASMMPPDMLQDDLVSHRQTPQDYGMKLDASRSSGENSGEPTPSLVGSALPPRGFGPPRAFESTISHERRKGLLTFIIECFHDSNNSLATEYRKNVLSGDHDKYPHVLSLPMLETYLSSFWNNVHPQLPILHRPTFATESCPDFLMLTMLALGASNLDRSHGYEMRTRSSDFSFFLAWHTRYRVYQEADFGPPAKLWIFQALLLLEIFEKMYSSRSLHERSHIHHSTTITLMRRGSSLIGRYSQDFPPFSTDPAASSVGHPSHLDRDGPSNGSTNASGFNTSDADWNAWISIEATRRIAFAAFIIDTTHAHMFGHSAVMVAHEMRIALPCDESMWAADSYGEVQAIRARLEGQGYRQVAFLEALKRTLNCQPVRTNTFGRVSIMAGLLSVSWHMKMQDVRVSSVGIGQAGAWGGKLLRAFDFWKKDFDESLAVLGAGLLRTGGMGTGMGIGMGRGGELDRDNVFEARTVLHHLAHMAMHCDVLDCMMYAGATRLLGRVITDHDRQAARRRMAETWAPSARARDSTFYALRFLSSALVPEDGGVGLDYSARNDVLLNRPWVLYLAAMVVWSYGFAREGPLKDTKAVHALTSQDAKVADMKAFLKRVGGGESPGQLEKVEGKNRVLGLFMVLRSTFLQARWELLHEAAELMGECVSMLVPGEKWEGMYDRASGR
ncbi:Zinc finger protein [Sphaceloma murrayae]|uniref:Zinc finger protein n=1 Tax=Sphaceloma murrayae TaxID=2082308 RepID=A0A2K1QUM7_9PEZI|nr:Zinc finger protein [Sphaceloma murrayae]